MRLALELQIYGHFCYVIIFFVMFLLSIIIFIIIIIDHYYITFQNRGPGWLNELGTSLHQYDVGSRTAL